MRPIGTIFLAAAALVAGPALGQERTPGPTGQPPMLVPVRAGKDTDTIEIGRQIMVTRLILVKETVATTVLVQEGDKIVPKVVNTEVVRQLPQTGVEIVYQSLPLRDLEIYDLRWRKVQREELRKAVANKTIAVLVLPQAAGGAKDATFTKIDSFYLQSFKEGTLILVVPAATMAPGGPGVVPLPEDRPKLIEPPAKSGENPR